MKRKILNSVFTTMLILTILSTKASAYYDYDDYGSYHSSGIISAYIWGAIIAFSINGIIWEIICYFLVKSKWYEKSENHGFAWGFWLGLIGLIVCCIKPNVTYQNHL